MHKSAYTLCRSLSKECIKAEGLEGRAASTQLQLSNVCVAVNDAPTGLKRIIQLFMYVRTHPDDNHYAHPLDFTPVADLNSMKATLSLHPQHPFNL